MIKKYNRLIFILFVAVLVLAVACAALGALDIWQQQRLIEAEADIREIRGQIQALAKAVGSLPEMVG